MCFPIFQLFSYNLRFLVFLFSSREKIGKLENTCVLQITHRLTQECQDLIAEEFGLRFTDPYDNADFGMPLDEALKRKKSLHDNECVERSARVTRNTPHNFRNLRNSEHSRIPPGPLRNPGRRCLMDENHPSTQKAETLIDIWK